MKIDRIIFGFIVLALAASLPVIAQESAVGTYQIRVSLDRPNWTYRVGEIPKFTVQATRNNSPAVGLELKYSCGPETLPPTKEGTAVSAEQPLSIDAGTMQKPGFLRCIVTGEKDGITYRGLATACFDPQNIRPTVKDPSDFDDFWRRGLDDVAKIPLEPFMDYQKDLSTPKVDVYHIYFQTVGTGFSKTSRIYGILCIPRSTDKDQKFPALLRVPGAGVRPYTGQVALAEQGIITLEVGIHGIPVNMPVQVYNDLRAGALNRYMLYNLDDRDTYYYRRVYLSMVKANDFLTSLPQYDGKNLAVTGGSQGGALAIVTAALDKRVRSVAASYPALSDMEGYMTERAGGWPHAFKDIKMQVKEKVAAAQYYDVVNFAKRLTIPGLYSWGFNDEVCPPTSMYAAYNSITAKKELMLGYEMGHANSPEQTSKINDWLIKELKK